MQKAKTSLGQLYHLRTIISSRWLYRNCIWKFLSVFGDANLWDIGLRVRGFGFLRKKKKNVQVQVSVLSLRKRSAWGSVLWFWIAGDSAYQLSHIWMDPALVRGYDHNSEKSLFTIWKFFLRRQVDLWSNVPYGEVIRGCPEQKWSLEFFSSKVPRRKLWLKNFSRYDFFHFFRIPQ